MIVLMLYVTCDLAEGETLTDYRRRISPPRRRRLWRRIFSR